MQKLLRVNKIAFKISYSFTSSTKNEYQNITHEINGRVGVIYLNRPERLNALCRDMALEVNDLLKKYQSNNDVGAIVITGTEKYFASGADIIEMMNLSYPETYSIELLSEYEYLCKIRKPIIAAISGFVLGGGCIYALICDILISSNSLKMGIPALNLGIAAGGSGAMRLTTLNTKTNGNYLLLSTQIIDAQRAQNLGLVSHVYEKHQYLDEAIKLGNRIAQMPPHLVSMIKECIYVGYDNYLKNGLDFERRIFWSLFHKNMILNQNYLQDIQRKD